MAPRIIPQEQLCEEIAVVLREAEAGQQFTVTVRGKPVASLGPVAHQRRLDVDAKTLREILSQPIDSSDLRDDLNAAEAPVTKVVE
ncbi:MAG: type II toxin-antitoxin system prevent-host-death family antitoxin [Solirubrobacterales bacterium]|nr:type II toxin-antitoxin system prevent-host-death family antitoxin [Solirubrobacterales bacterium]